MAWLLPVYIGATIFGVGITVADLIGAFSGLTDQGEGDADGDDADDVDVDAEMEADDADEGGDDDGAADSRGSYVGHDRQHRKSAVLKIMTILRSAVYFTLGFGPVGLFATTQYQSNTATLAWSLPVGLVVMVGTRMLRSFMRRDLSSDIKNEDLLMERGVVTVTIGKGQLGKVKATVGGAYAERFARAKDENSVIPVGSAIRIVDVADDCVYVEEE